MPSAPFFVRVTQEKDLYRLLIIEMVCFHQVRSLDSKALKWNELERLAYPNAERGGCFRLGAAWYVFFLLHSCGWHTTFNTTNFSVRPLDMLGLLWPIFSTLSGRVNGQGAWFLTPTHIASTKEFCIANVSLWPVHDAHNNRRRTCLTW